MLRLSICFFASLLLLNHLYAQTEHEPNKRFTVESLSPTEAKIYHETNLLEAFAQNLTLLKTAFTDQDASRIVAYEAIMLRAMRNAADQAATNPADPRLEKMDSILADFEAHAFDPSDQAGALRDFAKLEAFYALLKEGLKQ